MVTPSSSDSPSSYRLWRWHGWKPLLVTLVVLGVGLLGFLYWYDTTPPVPPRPDRPPVKISMRLPPVPPNQLLHRVMMGHENGRRVWRIIAVENGDEIIVDAASGTLIAIRDKLGKTIWRPMVATKLSEELPMKS